MVWRSQTRRCLGPAFAPWAPRGQPPKTCTQYRVLSAHKTADARCGAASYGRSSTWPAGAFATSDFELSPLVVNRASNRRSPAPDSPPVPCPARGSKAIFGTVVVTADRRFVAALPVPCARPYRRKLIVSSNRIRFMSDVSGTGRGLNEGKFAYHVSTTNVTGPSLTNSTIMWARKRPVETGMPCSAIACAKTS